MHKLLAFMKGDKIIWMIIIILSAISLLLVYSSSSTLVFKQKNLNTEYYMFKHLLLILTGFGLMYVMHLVKFKYLSRIAQLLFIISIFLLTYTLFWGIEVNEAKRWVALPFLNLTFQSSDLAKLALILFVARALSKRNADYSTFKSIITELFIPILIVIGLIFPSDNSTAGILFIICLLLLYFGGISGKILAKFSLYSALSITILFLILSLIKPDSTRINTFVNRIDNFLFEKIEEGSHEEQAMIAIANGKLLGKLPGQSTQKYKLPHPYSDSIYAFLIEEYGLLGGIFVLLMFMIFLYRGISISIKANSKFTGLVALGITFMIVFQAFIHILVAIRLFPMTGQPLPFISMGGTSILIAFIAVGILLNISRESNFIKEGQKNEKQ